jgi:hypothetical protein
MSLATLPDVHVVAAITEAGLLSGSSKKDRTKDATGGLLAQIGAHGFLVMKDFTSILEMHRDARASLLAALREIADGRWVRTLGTDGGASLEWKGRIGVLGCVTSVIDNAHAVTSVMGERFLLCRMGDYDGKELARRALDHAGREDEMREDLTAAIAGLFAGELPSEPHSTSSMRDPLVCLAQLVARARSAVQHNAHSGDIELVLEAEAPTRLVKALGRLYAACGSIGLDVGLAWRVVCRVGLDSIPTLRLAVLRQLAATPDWCTTSDVRTAVPYPTSTLRRCLADLAAHSLVELRANGQGTADRWRLYDSVGRDLRAIDASPEMSSSLHEESLEAGGEAPRSATDAADDATFHTSIERTSDTSGEVAAGFQRPSASDVSGEVIDRLTLELGAQVVEVRPL